VGSSLSSVRPLFRVFSFDCADSDEAGHAFQYEAGHPFRDEAGHHSDLKPAAAWAVGGVFLRVSDSGLQAPSINEKGFDAGQKGGSHGE